MSASGQRISARDYKRGSGRRRGFDAREYRQFFIGLAIGLAIALAVFIFDHRGKPDEAAAPQAQPAKKPAAPGGESEEPVEQYDFYSMLPKYEVVLPEERNVRPDRPAEPITQPGSYMIQAGSFINEPDAQRRKELLAKMGITAVVQRVAIDADVRHRVRIGPVSDLKRLNEIRNQIRTADIEMLISKLPQ